MKTLRDMTEPDLRDESKELVIAALRWYANPSNYEESAPGKGAIDGKVSIVIDGGIRARNILKVLGIPLQEPQGQASGNKSV